MNAPADSTFEDLLVHLKRTRSFDFTRYKRKSLARRVDHRALVRDVVGDLRVAVAEARAEIVVRDLPVVRGAPALLQRLFQNLLLNAIKFRVPGRAPRVEVEARAVADRWEVVVRDDGVGIPPEHRERVFGLFQRVHAQHEAAGSGIGLATCRKIVRHHGGSIWIEAAPAQGTEVHFTLPREGTVRRDRLAH